MVARLTGDNKELSSLLAEFRASVEAAQQQHASWSASSARLGRHPSKTNKDAAAADAGQPQAADRTLEDLQGRTNAAAVAAAEHVAVVKQLIDLVSGLNRRCSSSTDQLQHLTSAVHQLQAESADVAVQLVTAADNQQDAAMQVSQVLDISKHLQSCVEGLAAEIDTERSAKKRLQQQMDALQQQVLFQSEALRALQSPAVSTAAELEGLAHTSKETSESVSSLVSSKSQLRKQLQKMLVLQQQLDSDLRDTQTVVAAELAAVRKHVQLRIMVLQQQQDSDLRDTQTVVAAELAAARKHVQLVNGCTVQSCKHQSFQLSTQVSSITSRVDDLEHQLTALLTARTAAAAASGSRRVGTVQPGNRDHGKVAQLQPQPHQQQQQQQQRDQQQQDQQRMMSDLLALLDSEASELPDGYRGFNGASQAAAAAAAAAEKLISCADGERPLTAAAAAAGRTHDVGSSSSSHKRKKNLKKGSKRPPWVFEVMDRPQQPHHHQQQQQQQQQQQGSQNPEVTLRPQSTASDSIKRRQGRSSNVARAVKDRLVTQQQQQQQQRKHDVDQTRGPPVTAGQGPVEQSHKVAAKQKRERWIP